MTKDENMEAAPRIELGMKVLQTSALPLGYGAGSDAAHPVFYGAGDGARTRHLCLGKAALYRMSYSRNMVPQSGIEPPTQGFSVPCSTD